MKKLLSAFLIMMLGSFCIAQSVTKKEEAKFTPPTIKKDKQPIKSKNISKSQQKGKQKIEVVKYTPSAGVKKD